MTKQITQEQTRTFLPASLYGLKARQQIIRERGGNPAQVDAEREADTFERPAKPAQATDGQGMGEDDSDTENPQEAAA